MFALFDDLPKEESLPDTEMLGRLYDYPSLSMRLSRVTLVTRVSTTAHFYCGSVGYLRLKYQVYSNEKSCTKSRHPL
jgi:hypothetical protein